MADEMFGPYRIGPLIGRGGMGEVHRAHDTAHDRAVALKRLAPAFHDDAAFRARFRREAQVVARLREPHVIPIHAYGEIDGRLYLDMRLVEGEDLNDLVARGPLEPERAVRIVEQVAGALDAAHADGLVHRDVKPSNVLVAPGDFVYLVDFGIARSSSPAATGITASGEVIGTVDYMAPERFADGPVGAAADTYALACVLFACLTGRRPFEVDGTAAQIYAHLQEPPPKARALNPAVPPALDHVIARGMAKDPAARHESAGALAAAARAALAAAPPQGGAPNPPGPVTPANPASGPNPVPGAAASRPVAPGAVALGAVAGGAVAGGAGAGGAGAGGAGAGGAGAGGARASGSAASGSAATPGSPSAPSRLPAPTPAPTHPAPTPAPTHPAPTHPAPTHPAPTHPEPATPSGGTRFPAPPNRRPSHPASPTARRAAIAAVAAAVVALTVVAYLVFDGRSELMTGQPGPATSTATRTTGTTTTRSTTKPLPTSISIVTPTTTGVNPGERALLDALPQVYRGNPSCTPEHADGPGVTAKVVCTEPNDTYERAVRPTRAEFRLFADRAAQDAHFQSVVTGRGIPRDDSQGGCRPKTQPIHYSSYWRDTSGPLDGDFTTCYLDGGVGVLWWTDSRTTTTGTFATAPGADNDTLDKLDLWWNTMVLSAM
ncbi:serine/threonine-protein kinase [Saccharothrix syringae]|uniref:serine/threonine-protein kinase n=1 Tax=Saccharothrix syringae TaxID=103733 RepID=UPI00055FB182|nr:serine/threonine-protein kinase [Saccharothrix syringae]